jgi:hypothetical protein
MGVESWCATWTPIEPLVAPGPRVTKAIPGRPVSLPSGLSHERGAALLPADDEIDGGRVVQRVQRGEEALARHREDPVAALRQQIVDQNAAAGPWLCQFTHSVRAEPVEAPRLSLRIKEQDRASTSSARTETRERTRLT